LGPLGTEATNRPIMPAPGDCDDGEIGGMMTGRGNRSTLRKPAPVPLCPPQTPHALPEREPGPSGWEASDSPLELRHGLRTELTGRRPTCLTYIYVHSIVTMYAIYCHYLHSINYALRHEDVRNSEGTR
jgi:hypothetical protein